ncbi:MAG: D-glycero-beta-D-manno-heptose-7-phosphate kinase [Ktedonobacteraceae bacterium]
MSIFTSLFLAEVVMRVEQLMEIIPTRNIMVVGDIMLDEYLWGNVRGISPEAPVPIVEIRSKTYALGGAGNVAANLANLGSNVYLAGVVGVDTEATKLTELAAAAPRISLHLCPCQDRPTTTKTRIIAHSQQMLRTDHEERNPIPTQVEADMLNCVRERLDRLHACVLSDYAKGVLTEQLLHSLITLCKEADVPVIVDPKGHRYSRYRGATLVTPNTAEANLAAQNVEGSMTIEQVADRLQGEIGDGSLLITRGPQGMSLFMPGHQVTHIPAQARNIYDVTGAGDTVVAVLALLLAAGMEMLEAARLANYAAGIVVGKVGTACVSIEELIGGV